MPRGRTSITVVRDADAIDRHLQHALVDVIVVDLLPATPVSSVSWRAIEYALRHPPIPVAALVAPRALDAPLVARLHDAGVSTVLLDGIDDAILRVLLQPLLLTSRFVSRADVLLDAHRVGPLAEAVWRTGVSHMGKLSSVETLARLLGMSREHLTRTLRAGGAPGPKQLLDLVRLLVVQTQLTAGVPVALAAARLGFSSVSHLARSARAAVGVTPRHWPGLTPEALIAAGLRRAAAGSVPAHGTDGILS